MRKSRPTTQFEKDVRRVERRGYEMRKLSVVLAALVRNQPLEPSAKDHPLKGKYAGMRECHIAPDWLLIYKLDEETVFLVRTGTHADLFNQ
jgi:mRNA interferase YafQ